MPLSAQTDDVDTQSPFYKDYIAKFYPKAFVIRSYFFEHKTTDEVVQALTDVINVIAEIPWFYVANDNNRFKIRHYWEFFNDQLLIIDDYVKSAYVNEETKKVFTKTTAALIKMRYSKQYFEFSKKNKRLADYFTKQKIIVLKDFYALRFDFVIKLFNESILFKEYHYVTKLYGQLNRFLTQLDGSAYEVRYRTALTVAQQLIDILRQDMVMVSAKGELAQFEPQEGLTAA